jgi:hypothetical protein
MIQQAHDVVSKLANPHVSIKVISGTELRDGGFGGLWGVGKGIISLLDIFHISLSLDFF